MYVPTKEVRFWRTGGGKEWDEQGDDRQEEKKETKQAEGVSEKGKQ